LTGRATFISMIDKALKFLQTEIGKYLEKIKLKNPSEEKVHLKSLVEYDGNIAIPPNSLGISLINIEEERVVKSQNSVLRTSEGHISHINPEIKLNLYILISAYFNDYATGLEYLSGAVRFFQGTNVFTHQNTPSLDPSIQKLIIELYTLNFEQQNHLWGSLGAKYLPSVVYKVRMIVIQEALKADEQSPITIINASIRGM
jgi:hypothetical protein